MGAACNGAALKLQKYMFKISNRNVGKNMHCSELWTIALDGLGNPSARTSSVPKVWQHILSLSAVLEIAPFLHPLVTLNQTTFSSSGRQLSSAWGNTFNEGHGMTTLPSNCHPLPSYPATCHALDKLFETENTICEVCCQLASRSDCNLSPSCQGAVTCLLSSFSFQSSMTSKQPDTALGEWRHWNLASQEQEAHHLVQWEGIAFHLRKEPLIWKEPPLLQ